jgi:uncharacterized membrane protein YgcG
MWVFIRSFLMALGVVALLVLPDPAAATNGASERIRDFRSYIVVHPDSTMTVTETITVNCARREIKRGIIREFPTTYRDRFGNTITVGFEVREVLRNGRPEPYHLKAATNGQKIYIGQKNVYLQPGVYTYSITYHTDRQLGYFQDFDELYWNVTGTGWTFPIDHAEAVVVLPDGAEVTQSAAYTGPSGAKGQDYRVSRDRAGNILFTTTRGLRPREGLTIAVAWPKGFVRAPSGTEKMAPFLKDNLSALLGLLWLLIVVGYYLVVWNQVGRDPEKGTIIPLFKPPQGFSPAGTRFLMRQGFDNKAFTAAVVDMAVKGYLTIEENNGDYTLRKRNHLEAHLSSGERKLARSLFSGFEDAVELKNQNHSIIGKARDALKSTLDTELNKVYFFRNSMYLIQGVILTAIALGVMFFTSSFQIHAVSSEVVFIAISAAILFYMCLNRFRPGSGSFTLRQLFGIVSLLVFSGYMLIIFVGRMPLGILLIPGLIILALVLTNLLFFYLLKAPTLKGRRVMDQIEGFKLYLSVAEKERLEMFHPPEKTPEIFEKYLPYALALDVENEWSEQFAEVLARVQVEGRAYSPGWYHGSSMHSFSPSRFSDNLGSSFTGVIASASTPPGSSSGSGGGGGGGGGFSGGGGGGGGGSGW